jgi:hypothetical protein
VGSIRVDPSIASACALAGWVLAPRVGALRATAGERHWQVRSINGTRLSTGTLALSRIVRLLDK